MKLHELKEATAKLKLPDTKHVAGMGGWAFRMGIQISSNPHRNPALHDAWSAGWQNASRAWDAFLKRNNADSRESRNKIWGSL